MAKLISENSGAFRFREISGSADPTVRAISMALGQTCEKTLNDLSLIALDTDVPVQMPIVYYRYLLRNGWIRQKQPRKQWDKRYTAAEWLALNPPMPMLLFMGKHTAFADEGCVQDSWDCSGRALTGLWVRREDAKRLVVRGDYCSGLHGDTPFRSQKIWDKPAIRRVLADCDKRSGLNTAELPIVFFTGGRALGKFGYTHHKEGSIFINIDYFEDRTFPEEAAEDTIRHEAAHHVDSVKFGKLGHGPTWKKACLIVGAIPERFYSEYLSERYRRRHLKERIQNHVYDNYSVGVTIGHPRYGEGRVLLVSGSGRNRILDVEFALHGVKRLGIGWVAQYCPILAA